MADYQDFTFEMWRGDTEVFSATVYQGTPATPVNITGASLKFTAKQDLSDPDVDAVFQRATGGNGITITDGPAGECEIALISANTSGLSVPTLCYCDLQLVDGSGNVSTTATGTLLIKVDVTQANT